MSDKWKILIASVVVIILAVIIWFLGTVAHAVNFEQLICDEQPDPALCKTIDMWYARVRQPGLGYQASCCGVGDAYWVDQIDKVTDQGVFVTITDDRNIAGRIPRNGRKVFVPNNKLDDKFQGNPTGHNVVFLGGDGGMRQFGYPDVEFNMPYVFCAFLLFNG